MLVVYVQQYVYKSIYTKYMCKVFIQYYVQSISIAQEYLIKVYVQSVSTISYATDIPFCKFKYFYTVKQYKSSIPYF